MRFTDRDEAGRKLAAALGKFRGQSVVVLALPRGGVQVAAPIAAAVQAPLDLILVRKIGVPTQPELAMGAVVDGAHSHVVRKEDVIRLTGVSEAEFAAVRDRELAEIERRRKPISGPVHAAVAGRIAVVVDDGMRPAPRSGPPCSRCGRARRNGWCSPFRLPLPACSISCARTPMKSRVWRNRGRSTHSDNSIPTSGARSGIVK